MTTIDIIANEFHIKPEDLMKESLTNYLHKKLVIVESDMYLIVKKYGINNIFELDEKIKSGFISEENAYDDYFKLDNLTAERDKILNLIEKI